MFAIKAGVKITKLQPPMIVGWGIVAECYKGYGQDCTITSGEDSIHGVDSFHPKGLALDFRSRNVPRPVLPDLVAKIKSCLGADYDVVLEKLDLEGEHIHVEYDPKA
jgi:hypothetical protein